MRQGRKRLFGLAVCLAIGETIVSTTYAIAQLRPVADTTLGGAVDTLVQPINAQADLIKGGTRSRDGSNLFHSFSQFSVGAGRSAYFDNPAGVQNILSRVTGNTRSEILGRLGVNGAANLYLLNPNGVLFGPDARLDIAGSFVVSTGTSFKFSDGSEFSATYPQAPPLLTVNLMPGLQNPNPVGTIANAGNLTVGQDLTLAGSHLNLSGQLVVGRDLTLYASDTVQIRDRVAQPFIAAAGGKVLMQGNQQIDIVALSHPQSGVFAGGDLVLRSLNSVNGDAHYLTGGNFRVEQLDGTLGNLTSLHDPIIRASGDVSLTGYFGASLHILAGGSVNIGTVIITGADATGNAINPTANPDLATVTLSNGTSLTVDGTTKPTLDIRAGTIAATPPGITGTDFFAFPNPNLMAAATGSNITLGEIVFLAPDGLILLTNQFQPSQVPAGTIQVGAASVFSQVGNGSSVAIDSRGDITIPAFGGIDTSSLTGRGGQITLLANETVSLADSAVVSSSSGGADRGGDITVAARSLSLVNGAALQSSTFGTGNAGNITINVRDGATFAGVNVAGIASGVQNNVEAGSSGNGGEVRITAGSLSLTDGAQIQSIVRRSNGVLPAGNGTAGNVIIDVAGSITLDGVATDSETFFFPSQIASSLDLGGSGRGGDITVQAGSLSITNGAFLNSSTFGIGDAGRIQVRVRDTATIFGAVGGSTSGIQSNVEPGGVGNGGEVRIEAGNLSLLEGGQIQTIVRRAAGDLPAGRGTAGNVSIDVQGTVRLDGVANVENAALFPSQIASVLDIGSSGKGGDITVKTGSFFVTNGALLNSSTSGQGDAGNISIQALDTVLFDGFSNGLPTKVDSTVQFGAVGEGGDITVTGRQVFLSQGALIGSASIGQGNPGDVRIHARDRISITGSDDDSNSTGILTAAFALISSDAPDATRGGNVFLHAPVVSLDNNAAVLTNTVQTGGRGGNISVTAPRFLSLTKDSFLSTGSLISGSGGDINIETGDLFLDNSSLSTSSLGTADAPSLGTAGNINVKAGSVRLNNEAGILANTTSGDGGNILLDVDNLLLLRRDSSISTTAGAIQLGGNGGNITINAPFVISAPLENSDITANAFTGSGGRITINTQGIFWLVPRSRSELARLLRNPPFDPSRLPTNDITASSESGVSGVININTPDTDPSRGLAPLPTNLADPANQIAQGCQPREGQSASAFVATGRGGLPPNPIAPLQAETVLADWVGMENRDRGDDRRSGRDQVGQGRDAQVRTNRQNSPEQALGSRMQDDRLIEAQGWMRNKKGEVFLVAQVPTVVPRNSPSVALCR